MTAEEFEELLLKVAPKITKVNTKMRQAVSAKERLAVTLRFLATGLQLYIVLTYATAVYASHPIH